MEKTIIKKTLSLLLAVLMMVSIVPVTAVANEGADDSAPETVTDLTPAPENPSEEMLSPVGAGSGENAPGPDEENQKQPGESGFQSNSGDPVRLELKFDIVEKEDGEEQAEQDKEDKEETENAEKKYTLRTVNKAFPGNTYIYARNWETEEKERYRSALSELRQTEDSILTASFRDGRNEEFTFDTLVEFTLSCTDWKGKKLDELNAMEVSLYLTTGDGELGAAEAVFNYDNGVPALYFSTNRLADLLLTVPNVAEKERRRQEAEALAEAERKEAEEKKQEDRQEAAGDPADQSGESAEKPHTWGEWTVVTGATCTVDGSRTRACTDEGCDATETEVIPAAGHRWDTEDEDAAATCTVCGETREASYPVELDGDRWRLRGDPDTAENADYWAALFGGTVLTGNPATDLLTVAVSQFGYRENTGLYMENREGETRNYCRYGAWAGQPYSVWNAAFTAFCLNYAGIPETAMPRESDASRWVQVLSERGLFAAPGEYFPGQGDLVFTADAETGACRVGIIWQTDPNAGTLTAIEGAVNHAVDSRLIALSDASVIGFGILPESITTAADPAADAAMPAQDFELTVEDMTVTVAAPAGAFPADTRMELAIVEDEAVLSAAAEAVLNAEADAEADPQEEAADKASAPVSAAGTEKKVSRIRAFDITFFDVEGNEVEPAVPVRVTMKSALMTAEKQSDVVHIDSEGVAVVTDAEKQDDAVSFNTGGFSTYVMVETETITTSFTTGDGLTYEITVLSGTDNGFPEGWQLAVSELTEENESYQSLVDRATDAVSGQLYGLTYVKLLDISLLDETGVRTEPATPVQVSVRLMDQEKKAGEESDEATAVVHFADGADAGILVEGVSVEGDTVTFTAESFSAYAIVQGPSAVPLGWSKVTTLAALREYVGEGLYIGTTGGYYLKNTTAPGSQDPSTTGIVKTTPEQSYPRAEAAQYYFELVEDTKNQFRIYCLDGYGNRQYALNTGDANLTFTTAEYATAFTVLIGSDGKVRFQNGDGSRYWNMWSGANGNHIACWTNATDGNNYFYIWSYEYPGTDDPYALNGKTYGLMYWTDGISGKALMSSASGETCLSALNLTVMAKNNNNATKLYVTDDSDISMWTFHYISNDRYYLTATVDGSTKYLKITPSGLTMVSTPDESCEIQVIPGTGTHAGEISLKQGNSTLAYSGTYETGFQIGGAAGSEWLHLVELSELTSDYVMTYEAQKVSVSDPSVTNGSRVIVYTRFWNDTAKKYEFYAVDQDGTLVRCYENGDVIEWVGGRLNSMLWTFVEYYWEGTTDPNYYYELYNQYSEKYIAPQASDGQILSDSTIGINMDGRRNGRYYSPIVAWDDAYYAYAGLKVARVGNTLKVVSCPISEADDFYFAIVQDIPEDDELTTVATVDHTQYGITMKMVNFGTDLYSGNNDNAVRQQMSNYLGSDNQYHNGNVEPNLLQTALGSDGYPISRNGNSLSAWFASRPEVNHLFLQSTYNATGYYEFDSVQNFAHLNEDTGTFEVYEELGASASSGQFHDHGHFWPYNMIEAGKFAANKNLRNALGNTLPNTDPRKYEQLYACQKANTNFAPDYYLGMEVTATFTQTPNGLDDWGHDIIYEFTGDDDFWLFVDGELIIDLGGVHDALAGSVNYRTGQVRVNGRDLTLRDLFYNNYLGRGHTEAEAQAYVDGIFQLNEDGQWIFKDYTTHTMRIYYLERGAGASNLHMRFNLASIKPGTVELTKQLSGVESAETVLAEFPYQILYKTSTTTKNEGTGAITETISDPRYLTNAVPRDPERTVDYVFYKDTTVPVTYKPSFTVGGIEYNDVFILKPEETATINFPVNTFQENEELYQYQIIECGVNTAIYEKVSVNGEEINGTAPHTEPEPEPVPENRKDYGIDYATTDQRARVVYDNAVREGVLRNLSFTKQLFDVTGAQQIHNDLTTFDFRLYLATETADIDASPANMHTYHVKNQNGVYCYWDVENQRITPLESGKTVYSALTPEELLAATFHTSPNGSITRIPVDYTVEVRDVLAGTKFKLVERPAEIPDGYSFQKYRYNGVDYTNPSAGVTDTVKADPAVAEPHVDVCNIKGFGLRINKVWTDADYMSGRGATYYAVYYKNGESLQLVEGSVRQMAYGTNTVYWYYDTLPSPWTDFAKYFLYEVKLTGNPTVEEDGKVVGYDSITPLDDGDYIELSGIQVGEERSSKFTYTVSYERGEVKPAGGNVREDTVTNSRPGIRIQKSDWAGTMLPGAVFRLTLGETEIGEYTSDTNGLITVAFLSEKEGAVYTLTEESAPQGYHGLESGMTVRITQAGALVINGTEYTFDDAQGKVTPPVEDSAYYTIGRGEDGTWILTVKNRPYGFRVLKKDKSTGEPMRDVQFKLYREIIVDGAHAFDPNPYPGFDNLITGYDGMLQLIPYSDKYLIAGKYELRETTPNGYEKLSRHAQFTVSATGAVQTTVLPGGASFETSEDQSDGSLLYTLTIENWRPRELTVTKVWEDADNQDGVRPAEVQVRLLANGNVRGDPVKLNEGNGWTYTWKDLPRYQDHAGTLTEIVYSVDEVKTGVITGTDGPGTYAFAVTGSATAGFTVTNTHTPETTTATITKAWDDADNQDGIRPSSVEVALTGSDGNTYKVTLDGSTEGETVPTGAGGYESAAWTATFVNLPKYKEGTAITYTDYAETETSVITGTDGAGTYSYSWSGSTVTNRHTPATTTVTVTKTWADSNDQDGIRPDALTLTLNGAPAGTTVPEPTVTKNGNSWTYTWSGLPKYNNGTEISYTVTENSVPTGYTVSGSPAQSGGTITNTHTPTPPPPPPPPGGPPVVPPAEIDDDDVPLAGFGTVNQVGDCYE